MTEKDLGAPAARKLSLAETILAIRIFLEGDLSPKEALDAVHPPEGGLVHDGETWCHRRIEHG